MSRGSEVDEFLAPYPDEVRETASAARTLLKGVFPAIEESVDKAAKLIAYGYGPGYRGAVCTLIMSQKGVKLGIFRGAELPDPKALMQGEGKIHRHVQLRSAADAGRPGLKSLLKVALKAWRARSAQSKP
jgi:hypothetical protein